MIKSKIDCYLLSAAAISSLSSRASGGFIPALALGDEPVAFNALDTFELSIRHSKRLLLQTAATLVLLDNDCLVVSQPVKSKPRFITDVPKGPVASALTGLSSIRSLLPIESGQMQAAALAFRDDEGKTVCRAQLLFLATEKGNSTALLRLQGIKGYDAALDLLRDHILELGGIAFNGHTLYGQLFPTQAAYDSKPVIPIPSDATAFVAANDIISAYIPIAQANEPGIIANHDTEFLHDYRVQLRKIRSVLSLFKGVYDDTQTQSLKARFAALVAPTGQARDLDVYLLEKRAYYHLVPKSLHRGLNTLFSMFARQRNEQQIALSRYLGSARYKQEISSLAKLFAKPENVKRGANAELQAHAFACALIWKRYRTVCKIATNIGPDTNDDEVHSLRIHCKKLRYLMEFFGPIFPPEAFASLLKPLKGLQNTLGKFNDYSVQQEHLHAALRTMSESRNPPGLEVAQSVGALVAVLHNRQLQERAKVMRRFARFNSRKTQLTFSALFKEQKD